MRFEKREPASIAVSFFPVDDVFSTEKRYNDKKLFRGDDMELADIRNELENTAKKLADFRGSL
jgi:hypothetical protein